MMDEIWRDIPGFDGYYPASNLGRIKSATRTINHAFSGTAKIIERILKPAKNRCGYLIVVMYKMDELLN